MSGTLYEQNPTQWDGDRYDPYGMRITWYIQFFPKPLLPKTVLMFYLDLTYFNSNFVFFEKVATALDKTGYKT